jgi:hypothetical protein
VTGKLRTRVVDKNQKCQSSEKISKFPMSSWGNEGQNFKMKKSIRSVILCLLLSPALFAQDVRGTWKGKIYSSAPGDSTSIEIRIRSNKKDVLSGSTTVRFGNFNFITAVIRIEYDSVAGTVYFQERTITDKDISDWMTPTLNEYHLKFEDPNRLTGRVICFRTLPPRIGLEGPCPGPMELYLQKQE